MNYLLPYYTSIQGSQTEFYISNFVDDICYGRVDAFMERLKTMFAGTPYDIIKDTENHYQNVMYIVCKLMGLQVGAEYRTSAGRIDMTLETDDYIYVLEFKLDGTAEEALKQIDDKDYPLPFGNSGKKIVKVGVNFSSQTRNIDRWIVE